MGDRCYMTVQCRREDKARFEDLGFSMDYEQSPDSAVVEMVDEDANYAHANEIPANIPYTASHGSGGNYGEGKIACDGKHYAEIPVHSDGFVVHWDYQKMKPDPKSIREIKRYIKINDRAEKMLKRLRQKEPHQHLFSTTTLLCHHCGISAEDDLVENGQCPERTA